MVKTNHRLEKEVMDARNSTSLSRDAKGLRVGRTEWTTPVENEKDATAAARLTTRADGDENESVGPPPRVRPDLWRKDRSAVWMVPPRRDNESEIAVVGRRLIDSELVVRDDTAIPKLDL